MKRSLAALALTAAILCPTWIPARAADLPDRPVRIIVPFAPGGSADIAARILAEGAAPYLPRGTAIASSGVRTAEWGYRGP